MARGSEAKTSITNQILKLFPNSFVHNLKEIRIPFVENGEVVEIKVALTAAKENVGGLSPSDLSAFPTDSYNDVAEVSPAKNTTVVKIEETKLTEPTEEEKIRLEKLLESF